MDADQEQEERGAQEEGCCQQDDEAEGGAGVLRAAARPQHPQPFRQLPDVVRDAEDGSEDRRPESQLRIVARLAVWVQGSQPSQARSPLAARSAAQAAVKNCRQSACASPSDNSATGVGVGESPLQAELASSRNGSHIKGERLRLVMTRHGCSERTSAADGAAPQA